MNNLVVLERAYRMIVKAKRWYRRRNPRAAIDFVLCVDEAFEEIARDPFQCQKWDIEYYFKRLARFPYVVYFRLAGNSICVVAVIHERRSPVRWKRGL